MSDDWPTIGLDYAETRFSKLSHITSDNVKSLGLVWSYSLESSRGVEATPVVVDGIMYQTASWSVVHAIDARTGRKIWTFDPGGYVPTDTIANLKDFVFNGPFKDQGMPDFTGKLKEDVVKIQAFIQVPPTRSGRRRPNPPDKPSNRAFKNPVPRFDSIEAGHAKIEGCARDPRAALVV